MMDEINFPIVYTVKPISCLNWKDYGRVIGYAVVEAYLISEIKRYKTDGSYEYLYEVVYTWNEDGRENIIPLFNRDNAFDSCYVNSIFTSLEEAKTYRDINNYSLFRDNILRDGLDKINEIKETTDNNLKYVLELENKHLGKHKIKSKLI